MVGRIPSYAGEDPSDPNSGFISEEVHQRLVHVVRKSLTLIFIIVSIID